MPGLKLFTFIFLCSFFINHSIYGENLIINKPKEITFKNPLQAGSLTSEYYDAKRILSALFYIAMCLGAINIVKTLVYTPDKARKVITNWVVGLIVYAIIYNIAG